MSWTQLGTNRVGTAGDLAGNSVSISGDGTHIAVAGTGGSGVVRVYNYTGGAWSQVGGDITGAGGNFGVSVSLSIAGNFLAVGASTGDYVRVYSYAGSWSQVGSDMTGSGSTGFGTSVSISDDGQQVAIGAPNYAGANINDGRAYVYANSGGWAIVNAPIDVPAGAAWVDSNFGTSVSLSGNGQRVAVGAVNYNTNNGSLSVWTVASGLLVGSEMTGGVAENFGASIALSTDGTKIIGGAPNNGSGPNVKIYTESGGTWSSLGAGSWPVAGAGSAFGFSVGISDTGLRVVVGARNSDYAEFYEYTGGAWALQSQKFVASSQFGTSVSMSDDGSRAIIGGPTYNTNEGIAQAFNYGGGGGGGGDPYVTTVDGIRYKLPIMDGAIRFYQGKVEGKTLTINTQLRTMENTDMIAENLRSFADLRAKMPAYKLREIEKSIFAGETLAFFEKFYIKYGETELVVNVWDHKFVIESYSGPRLPSSFTDGNVLTQKYTGIYKDYKSQTLKLNIGAVAALYLSVYPAKLLKSGIYIENVDMAAGNGVIVNTLSQTDMTLPSLTDLSAAPQRNTRPREKEEWFLDKDGYRTKKILRAAH